MTHRYAVGLQASAVSRQDSKSKQYKGFPPFEGGLRGMTHRYAVGLQASAVSRQDSKSKQYKGFPPLKGD